MANKKNDNNPGIDSNAIPEITENNYPVEELNNNSESDVLLEPISENNSLDNINDSQEKEQSIGKVIVNFGVYIPSMQKSFTKEEIEADPNIIDYLLSIGSQAVSKN